MAQACRDRLIIPARCSTAGRDASCRAYGVDGSKAPSVDRPHTRTRACFCCFAQVRPATANPLLETLGSACFLFLHHSRPRTQTWLQVMRKWHKRGASTFLHRLGCLESRSRPGRCTILPSARKPTSCALCLGCARETMLATALHRSGHELCRHCSESRASLPQPEWEPLACKWATLTDGLLP